MPWQLARPTFVCRLRSSRIIACGEYRSRRTIIAHSQLIGNPGNNQDVARSLSNYIHSSAQAASARFPCVCAAMLRYSTAAVARDHLRSRTVNAGRTVRYRSETFLRTYSTSVGGRQCYQASSTLAVSQLYDDVYTHTLYWRQIRTRALTTSSVVSM